MNENGSTLSVNVISFVPLSMMGYFKGPVHCVDTLLCLRMSAVEVKLNWLGCCMNGKLLLGYVIAQALHSKSNRLF